MRISLTATLAALFVLAAARDAHAVDTTITSSPSNPTDVTSATFSLESDVSPATFECSLDGGPFTACPTPQTYSSLALGQHTFQARALDSGGLTDPTPASHAWTIVAPDAGFDAGFDVGFDDGFDAGLDVGFDAGFDVVSPLDARDAGPNSADAPRDATARDTTSDAGFKPKDSYGGCGCSTAASHASPGAFALVGMVGLALVARRRRRAAR